MPQMKPMYWLNLFIFFTMNFLIMFMLTYFTPSYKKNKPFPKFCRLWRRYKMKFMW